MATDSNTAALGASQGEGETSLVIPAAKGPTTTATTQPEPAAAAEVPAVVPTEPKTDWAKVRMQEKINKLTAQKAAAERELAELRTAKPAGDSEAQQRVLEQAKAEAKAEAAKEASWNSFVGQLNEAISAGQKEFGQEKFDAHVQALRAVNDPNDLEVNTKYVTMLQAIVDTGAAPKLLAQLGEDPNEAMRLMSLSPTKMGVELAKLALKEVEDVSRAPKPITPVTGVGRTHVAIDPSDPERSDQISDMRVWIERRSQHVADVNKRAGRRVLI